MTEERWQKMREAGRLYGGLYAEAVEEIEAARADYDAAKSLLAEFAMLLPFLTAPGQYNILGAVGIRCERAAEFLTKQREAAAAAEAAHEHD